LLPSLGRFDPGERAVVIILRGGYMSPVTDVRALEARNVWEIESLFFVSSNRNSRLVTVREGLGEINDKFLSAVTLSTPRLEVVNSKTRVGDKDMTCSTKAYEVSESFCFGRHWCCAE
jgi:hypothetical protein